MKIEFSAKVLAGAVATAPVAAIWGLTQYAKRHQGTPEEAARSYPGDDLVPESPGMGTRAITIDAPQEKVWLLINQLGLDTAGFYSFSIFERLSHFLIHNTYEPQVRFQHTKAGDWIFYGQQGIGSGIIEHVPGKYMTTLSDTRKPPTQEGAIAWLPAGWKQYAWCWNFHVTELPGGKTRLIFRLGGWGEIDEHHKKLGIFMNSYLWGWSGTVMTTRMLEVLRACAEGKPFIKF